MQRSLLRSQSLRPRWRWRRRRPPRCMSLTPQRASLRRLSPLLGRTGPKRREHEPAANRVERTSGIVPSRQCRRLRTSEANGGRKVCAWRLSVGLRRPGIGRPRQSSSVGSETLRVHLYGRARRGGKLRSTTTSLASDQTRRCDFRSPGTGQVRERDSSVKLSVVVCERTVRKT